MLLQKGNDGEWHSVIYFSKIMVPAKVNYPIHDKEMLVIIRLIKEWRLKLKNI